MELSEPVRVEAYDPRWPQIAAEETLRLHTAPESPASVEHFGSTAVPGLPTKPIIDLLVGFDFCPPPAAQIDALETLGYECLGEAGVPGRIYCRKRHPQSSEPAFNLALVDRRGARWRDNLLLRDSLRAHPAESARYAAHKRTVLNREATDLRAYSEAKSGVVQELLRAARTWASRAGVPPGA